MTQEQIGQEKQSGFLKKFPNISGKAIQNKLRKFGSFMAGMVMPVIGVIIAWGLFTAIILGAKTIIAHNIGIQVNEWNNYKDPTTGELITNHSEKYLWNMDIIIGYGIHYLIPLFIAFFAGKQIFGTRGGLIGAASTLGVIGGAATGAAFFNQIMVDITGNEDLLTASPTTMIMGAMIMAPIAAWCFKKLEALWADRIKSGFEMLINNLSLGLLGLVGMFVGFWAISPLMAVLQSVFYIIINGIYDNNLLPLMPLFVETEKVLFLNNAVNHGIFGPLGYTEAASKVGQSVLFFLDPNPGQGMGLLLAYMLFSSSKEEKGQAAAAAPIHFIGGIHEVYYPFVLTNPINLLWMIAGGTFATFMYEAFNVGGIFTPSPGSIIMCYAAVNPVQDNYIGLTLAIFGAMLITFVLVSATLIIQRMYKGEKIYFNPYYASIMVKYNNANNFDPLVNVNKLQKVESVSYEEQLTNKNYLWEKATYDNGDIEYFVYSKKAPKVVRFEYQTVVKKNIFGKDKEHFYLYKYYEGKEKPKRTILKNVEKKITDISYENMEMVNKTRIITFKPIEGKNGKIKTPKPLKNKYWQTLPEETMASIEQQATKSTKKTTNGLAEVCKTAKKIYFACEAGMGSSAMGAGLIRKYITAEKIKGLKVSNCAIKDLPPDADIVVTQETFEKLVPTYCPTAYVYTIKQFLNLPEYDELINTLKEVKKESKE